MTYILPDARASYVHWWTQQLYWMEWYYRYDQYRTAADDIARLYPHLAPPRRKRRRYTRWGEGQPRYIRPWDISTSGESRFVQSGYAKKEISDVEQSRRDWRERKGFRRDQAKGRCWCKCNLNDAKRGRRAWERDKIRKGQYDDLDQYDKNMFTDGWDCC